jgi:pyruvate dehydrogenase E2 component (dihydrolipoamide acetyltransferase)
MAKEFKLPDLGSGLKECEILRWCVAIGDEVTTDDILCEVETEKAVIEIPVPFTGRVHSLAAAAGESVLVGETLAVIGGEAEAQPVTGATSVVADKIAPPGKRPASEPAETPRAQHLLHAMPAVRRLAREHNIDLEQVPGTGRNGRVTKKDVLAWMKQAARDHKPSLEPEVLGEAPPPGERVKLSKLRKTIAGRMSDSWREIPHVFTRIEVDATEFLRSRKSLSEVYGIKVPIEALLIKAVLPALRRHPEFNATLDGDELLLHSRYDIALAVNTDDGLVLPTIRAADRHSLAQLAEKLSELLPRAAERRASADELSGGTFTVNNIGALGNLIGTSIIPHGTTAILSVGRASEKPVVRDGQVQVSPVMEVTLSFDHRVIDGSMAQRFMEKVQRNLEDAVRLLA